MNAVPGSPRRRPLNVSDYHRMGDAGIFAPDERVELIDGEIIAMPPIGPAHAGLVDRLHRRLGLAVGDHALVRGQNPVRLSDFSEPEPDVALVRPRDDDYMTGHPGPADTLLVVEVSDATLVHDRDVKALLYARHGIPEFWLVDVQTRRIVIHREPDGREYANVFEHPLDRPIVLPLDLAEPPDMTIDLSRLFTK